MNGGRQVIKEWSVRAIVKLISFNIWRLKQKLRRGELRVIQRSKCFPPLIFSRYCLGKMTFLEVGEERCANAIVKYINHHKRLSPSITFDRKGNGWNKQVSGKRNQNQISFYQEIDFGKKVKHVEQQQRSEERRVGKECRARE